MKTLSVYEIVHHIKNVIDSEPFLQNVLVSGEISNFHHHSSGHLYFSIKDDRSRINCVMFKGYTSSLNFKPKDGDKVLIKASTSVFLNTGQLQLYVTVLKKDGIGDLYLEFERLKQELAAKGWFDPLHKKIKPDFPFSIAVLCAEGSAALSDIQTALSRRWPLAEYHLYPVLVQGESSAKDIIDKLKKADEKGYDAIILARGGGSIEDLWSFNDAELAYTIFALNTFIITGIGHEQDYTIAGFVSDLRAPTPTAAVELLTPDIRDVEAQIAAYAAKIKYIINRDFETAKNRLDSAVNSRPLSDPSTILSAKQQYLDYLSLRVMRYGDTVKHSINTLANLSWNMINQMHRPILIAYNRLDIINQQLKNAIKYKYDGSINRLRRNTILLEAYTSEKTLQRGYAIVSKNQKVITSAKMLALEDDITIRFKDGKVNAQIKEINDAKEEI